MSDPARDIAYPGSLASEHVDVRPDGVSPTAGDGVRLSRRSNPKVKTGCRTCKKRKIKCDESRPSCRNCTKHAVTCDFIHDDHQQGGSTASPPSATAAANLASNSMSGGSTPSSQSPLPGIDTPGPEDVNLADLELIHTFTTSTCNTLSSVPAVRQAFRAAAVQTALRREYVMRALLAVTALHVAHFRGRGRRGGKEGEAYAARGARYFEAAGGMVEGLVLRVRRDTRTEMEMMSTEEMEGLYLFLLFAMYYGMGFLPKHDDEALLIGAASSPHWMDFLRVMPKVHDMMKSRNYSGPLKPLVDEIEVRMNISAAGTSTSGMLLELEGCVRRASASADDDPDKQRVSDICRGVIEHLARILAPLYDEESSGTSYQPGNTDGDVPEPMDVDMSHPSPSRYRAETKPRARAPDEWDVFIFLWTFARDFLSLLQGPMSEVRQEVMCVFAHFLILLKKAEGPWWMEGWAVRLMGRIWGALDQEHRLYVRWPVEELGWVPS